ncbi:MAG: DUF2304 family protein [Patescibacteria group bacterium]|jgi:hypothetical protein
MAQLLVAAVIILFFLAKLYWQKRKGAVSTSEFIFWFVFWVASLVLVAFLKQLDQLVASFGFSVSAIQVAVYLAIAVLFYLIFRVRIKLEKIEENLTKINEAVTKQNKKV